ncbi:MAG: site-specific DNA-methyltransferase, partial [Acidobacteriota bacterium]|nr:site-specific DNA-methyltransferase [Acidobacteriota bacterium]
LTYYAGFLNQQADFKHWISWDAPTAPMGKSLQPNHYGILFYAKDVLANKFYELRYPHKRCLKCGYLHKDYGGKKFMLHPFGSLVSDVWTDIHRVKHNKYRDEHPCQLPIHLLERVVLMSTDENDIVLDPFSGTGTTALAAKRLGRNFIGFEFDAEYAKIATNKLASEEANSKIGEVWLSFHLNEAVTIRDKDWTELAENYLVPEPIEKIDNTRIIQRKSNLPKACIAAVNANQNIMPLFQKI